MIHTESRVAAPRRRKLIAPGPVAPLLTEAQVSAMPGSGCTDSAQVGSLKSQLETIGRERLDAAANADVEIVTDVSGADPLNRKTAEGEHWMSIASHARDVEKPRLLGRMR